MVVVVVVVALWRTGRRIHKATPRWHLRRPDHKSSVVAAHRLRADVEPRDAAFWRFVLVLPSGGGAELFRFRLTCPYVCDKDSFGALWPGVT